MKTTPLLLALAAAVPLAAFSQEAPERTPEEIAAAIGNVEAHIQTRETRATELTNDLIRLDERVEGRIERVVEMLEGITDSRESQVRVARLKERVIEGLRKMIDVYDQSRRAIQQETHKRDPKLTREELFSDLGKFDERVDKRVEQILGLTKSMHTHVDKDKSRTVHGGYGYGRGWSGNYEVRNPDYQLNKKQTRHTDAEKKEIAAAIDAAVERLDRQNREIDETLRKDVTDQYREMLEYEKQRNLEIIEMRQAQKADLITDRGNQGDPIGRGQAIQIENMLEDMSDDLKDDFYQIFNVYRELNQERAALKTLNEQLAALKAMQQ